MADSEAVKKLPASANEELLKDIREDYIYFRDFWRDNHNEMKTDLRFISGDPWEPDDRRNREDNNRPVLCPDELSQYQNATINNLRQNKRAIKVQPKGSGATDKDAEMRSAIIKGIEYKSNAQSAYTNAFENQINCGMGFFRVTTKTISKEGEVEPWIKGIENPLSVLLDPNAKEPDFSDMKRCFVMDIMRLRDFKKQYPKAEHTSFAAEDTAAAPDWFQAENILVAEYWRIDGYDAETGEGGKVTQYITNGLEILSETSWPGSWIPIISAMGKKVYVPVGSEMKRFYYSQIRLARGPQMMLAYGASQEAEVVGMMPRVPTMGYVGQFETDKEAWDTLNTVPRAYIQVDPVVDEASGQLLPLPTRVPLGPDLAGYEAFNERWRRSIQAAMGITPLPTAAQRQNEKSGIALEKIQNQQAIGSFHFTDNFDRAIENAGRQVNELITLVMDTDRDVTTRNPDDTHDTMHIVPGGKVPQAKQGQQPIDPDSVFDPKKGDFDVTISAGMSYQSQREEAGEFVDLLIQNLGSLPIPPPAQAAILAKAITLKDIGPIGDEIAQIIDPQQAEGVSPQMQQLMQQNQHLTQALGQVTEQLKEKTNIKAMELESNERVEFAKLNFEKESRIPLDYEKLRVQLAVAELTAKTQANIKQAETEKEIVLKQGEQAHEYAMQQDAQQAQQQLAEQQGGQDGSQQQPVQAANGETQQPQTVQPAESTAG